MSQNLQALPIDIRVQQIADDAIKQLNTALLKIAPTGKLTYEGTVQTTEGNHALNQTLSIREVCEETKRFFKDVLPKEFGTTKGGQADKDDETPSTATLNRKRGEHKLSQANEDKDWFRWRIGKIADAVRLHYAEIMGLAKASIEQNPTGGNKSIEEQKALFTKLTNVIDTHLQALKQIYDECQRHQIQSDESTPLVSLSSTTDSSATNELLDVFTDYHYYHCCHRRCDDSFWYWYGFNQASTGRSNYGGWDVFVPGGYGNGYADAQLVEFVGRLGIESVRVTAHATEVAGQAIGQGLQALGKFVAPTADAGARSIGQAAQAVSQTIRTGFSHRPPIRSTTHMIKTLQMLRDTERTTKQRSINESCRTWSGWFKFKFTGDYKKSRDQLTAKSLAADLKANRDEDTWSNRFDNLDLEWHTEGYVTPRMEF